MRKEERKAYTDAVTCLQKTKSKTPEAVAPGARGRVSFEYEVVLYSRLIGFRMTTLQ